jgi:hypothetical protein
MKLVISAVTALAAIGIASGTASAQYPALVPHRGHYHVVPTYSAPRVAYAVPAYSPGLTFGGYVSPGIGFGGYYSSPGFGYGRPAYFGFGGGHHHHHHHHHHQHGHHHHR